jgi:hypothetical protein
MFRSRFMVGAVALAGLALAGFAALALGKWFADSPNTEPREVAVKSGAEPEVPPTEKAAKELTAAGHVEPPRLLEAALSRLHTEAVTKFTSAPGFGMRRMPVFPMKVIKEWKIPWWSPGELDKEAPLHGKKDLELIHQDSLKDFSTGKIDVPLNNPPGAVFLAPIVKGQTPPSSGRENMWEMKSLDLVGLIKHKEPVVYISDKLPEMKDLKETPTRPADLFEFTALECLQKGDNLFARGKDDTIRMLGAIRAGKKCLSCHDDRKEGDLLGAFSYTLRLAEYKLENSFDKNFPPVGNKGAGKKLNLAPAVQP